MIFALLFWKNQAPKIKFGTVVEIEWAFTELFSATAAYSKNDNTKRYNLDENIKM